MVGVRVNPRVRVTVNPNPVEGAAVRCHIILVAPQ